MIELVATVIITVSSVLLFGYWFRYTCLLILSAKTTRNFAAELGRLCDALDRDYAILTRLLQQTSTLSAEGSSIEKRMLDINYHVTRAWYRASGQFSTAAARRA